eukprot:753820-Rhodomonas_salina.2
MGIETVCFGQTPFETGGKVPGVPHSAARTHACRQEFGNLGSRCRVEGPEIRLSLIHISEPTRPRLI